MYLFVADETERLIIRPSYIAVSTSIASLVIYDTGKPMREHGNVAKEDVDT